jgi:hypothetical protein
MNYIDKYLKYKAKYLNLLNKIIVGGMAERAIQTGEINSFLFTYYDVNNWDDLLIKVRNDNNITNDNKINLLGNELGDIEHLLNDENNIDEPNKILGKEILLKIKNELEKHYNVPSLTIELILLNAKILKSNSYYNVIHEKASKYIFDDINVKRGEINEDEITEKQSIKLSIIDNDNSTGYNTKNFNAYDPKFIDILKNIFTLNDKKPSNSIIINHILKYVPVDIVKNNTIWEIKSLDDFNKNYNSIKTTKLKGYTNNNISIAGILINGKMSFNFEFTVDGKKVKNIIFELIGKKQIRIVRGKLIYEPNDINIKIPILKENPNGYDYYWYMSNSTGDRYYSPLTDQSEINNFINELKDLGIDITKIINEEELNIQLYNKKISQKKIIELLNKYFTPFEI